MLFIFGGGVREETFNMSLLNKLGDLLFLGGTFRLLALGAGWGQKGRGGRAGNGAELHVWEPGTLSYHLGLACQDAQCPSLTSPVCRLWFNNEPKGGGEECVEQLN